MHRVGGTVRRGTAARMIDLVAEICGRIVRASLRRVAGLLIASSMCASCNSVVHFDSQPANAVNPPGDGNGSNAEHPTYYQDVEPILRTHCVDCHRPAGAAPFALAHYEQARALATSIASVTASQRMPPWPAGGEGDWPPQVGPRRLEPTDIALNGAGA